MAMFVQNNQGWMGQAGNTQHLRFQEQEQQQQQQQQQHLSNLHPQSQLLSRSSQHKQPQYKERSEEHDTSPRTKPTKVDSTQGGKNTENLLSVHNATWFLELLEEANMEELNELERTVMRTSSLRHKTKHRTAILFQDDAHFVLKFEHKIDPKGLKERSKSTSNSSVLLDPRMALIREACKEVIDSYRLSIDNAPLRSCVWSALMHRAAYHLQRCGIDDVDIIESQHSSKEAMFHVQGHQITRSNFTKIARQFCDNYEQKEAVDSTKKKKKKVK
mmetsp:Transcript_13658/g.25264  ORF Transcript_13658/g.25264 Transcript_13658/m.25264 type:complete len:274 (-) Transcript_13658:192-1013(-)